MEDHGSVRVSLSLSKIKTLSDCREFSCCQVQTPTQDQDQDQDLNQDLKQDLKQDQQQEQKESRCCVAPCVQVKGPDGRIHTEPDQNQTSPGSKLLSAQVCQASTQWGHGGGRLRLLLLRLD